MPLTFILPVWFSSTLDTWSSNCVPKILRAGFTFPLSLSLSLHLLLTHLLSFIHSFFPFFLPVYVCLYCLLYFEKLVCYFHYSFFHIMLFAFEAFDWLFENLTYGALSFKIAYYFFFQIFCLHWISH